MKLQAIARPEPPLFERVLDLVIGESGSPVEAMTVLEEVAAASLLIMARNNPAIAAALAEPYFSNVRKLLKKMERS